MSPVVEVTVQQGLKLCFQGQGMVTILMLRWFNRLLQIELSIQKAIWYRIQHQSVYNDSRNKYLIIVLYDQYFKTKFYKICFFW